MSGLRNKITEIARTTAQQVVNQYNATATASASNSNTGTASVQSVSTDTNGNRIVTVLDAYGNMNTVFLNTSRPIGYGDNVLLLNGSIAQ